jgi:riboflavin kinase/FMN adenylyltransferase
MLQAHYSTLEEVKSNSSLVLAIGVFDGLHLGHLDLVQKLCHFSKRIQAKPAIWTFDSKIPKPGFTRLMSEKDYLEELENQGVMEFHCMEFTDEVSQMEAEAFLKEVLIEKLHVSGIVLGEDARLGKNRSCSAQEFKQMAKSYEIEVELVPLLKYKNEAISSSKIRESIKKGDFEKAEALLGRPYVLSGTVVKDQQLARKLGFPTANIRCHDMTLPPNGVYRCEVELPDGTIKSQAIAYIGSRPTVSDDTSPVLEVHLKNFDADLYDFELKVFHFEKIRSEMKFENLEALQQQLNIDIEKI